ncbi:phage shock protein C-like protein [Gottschalkia purinilytica]|uniref:Phage shock protein C-like protein n=1 Tax=Gottschalkia purinilytica TaxID=1503 RepID=A0A0L0WDG3_GOTPU|nr:PspC domain-containing protein [Gottschalkia purinilytica]KNF09519.1 phage shock protein C-like protein [Gottschalkia purinilytica]
MSINIYRSNSDKMISGVCGGLGKHFDISSDIVRVIWIILGLSLHGFAVFGYILCAILMPQDPNGSNAYNSQGQYHYNNNTGSYKQYTPHNSSSFTFNEKNKRMLGIFFIIIGLLFLIRKFFIFDPEYIYAALLIIAGIFILIRGGKNNEKR